MRFPLCALRASANQTLHSCRPARLSRTWTQSHRARQTLTGWVTQTTNKCSSFPFAQEQLTEQVGAMQSKIHHSIIHAISPLKLTSERQISSRGRTERRWEWCGGGWGGRWLVLFPYLICIILKTQSEAGGGGARRAAVERDGGKGRQR